MALSCHERSHHGCLSRLGAQRSGISAFNHLAIQICAVQKGFSSSVCQAVVAATRHLQQPSLPAVLERMDRMVCSRECTKQCHIGPYINCFLVGLSRVGLPWHTVGNYHSAISAFLEPYHHHKASNHPFISKLMHHFYLQHPPYHCFFLGMSNMYCDCLISTFCFIVMLLFSFLHLVKRQIDLGIFLLKFILNVTPVLIFGLYFIWRTTCNVLSLLGRSWMDCV